MVNKKKKVIAEIKNKFNTAKGNHKKDIYDDFNNLLENKLVHGLLCGYFN
ncbi:Eco47II family restriction endonuclease [Candidatus Xenohaliotis californiensis]